MQEQKSREFFHLGFALPCDTHVNAGEIVSNVLSAESSETYLQRNPSTHRHWEVLFFSMPKINIDAHKGNLKKIFIPALIPVPFKIRRRQCPPPPNAAHARKHHSGEPEGSHYRPPFPAPKPRQPSWPQQSWAGNTKLLDSCVTAAID